MNNLYIEAYCFYKKQYAPNIVLFHVASRFETYMDDAEYISRVLNLPMCSKCQMPCCGFPDIYLQDALTLLIRVGIPVSIVEYRNKDGSFDVPKVKQILQDMEDDY